MSTLNPPPRIVDKFTSIWRDWLSHLFSFTKEHTGGSTPVSPATGTSWNAHGNTATGSSTQPLLIDAGSFGVTSSAGGYISELADRPLVGSPPAFAWMPYVPSLGGWALRIGSATGTTWNEANLAGNSVGIGHNANAGSAAVAIGNSAVAGGLGGLVLGAENSTVGYFNTAIGANYAICDDGVGTMIAGMALGYRVTSAASFASVIGSGAGVAGFVNSTPSSMALGANIDTTAGNKPTLFLINKKCGVEQTSPLSTLDVGGSVGAQYRTITGVPSTTTTIIASENEYTFRIDISGFTSGQQHEMVLPAIAGIDRRIYYFKVTDIAGSAPAGLSTGVLITPDSGGDKIETLSGGPTGRASTGSILIGRGDAVTLIANATDSTWWII